MDWNNRRVLVTGGASFIGSHLVEALAHRGARVHVVDDLTSGKLENLQPCIDAGKVTFVQGDLREPGVARQAVQGIDVVFHLAADHGGRGYVDLHQYGCSTNLGLDALLFGRVLDAGVEKVVYASSGCIYPLSIQSDPAETLFLTEDMAGPPYEPDGLYGLAKLAGELTLQALHAERGLNTASCRYFTVYGPRGVENHAVMAMIARAFIREDPYVVWGNGEQVRNWTYVSDIVAGTMAAGEHLNDGSAVNLGTMERVRVSDAVTMVLRSTGHRARIEGRPDMPTGPMNRVADNARARALLGWEPKVCFAEGLQRTIEWYFSTKDPEEVRQSLGLLLTERPVALTERRVAQLTG
jgi:nucleoside-diphosphate-sugar epimerase